MKEQRILLDNKPIILLLVAMMFFGFYLRSFHIDFPSIGYHNMKENEYLSQALNHYNDGDFLRRKMHIFGREDSPYFEEYPQMPLLPWMFELLWLFFGVSFWSARLVIIAFSLATIPALYVLVKRLTQSDYLALTSAFLFSFMPLAVFFGRNIQPESPALFFLVLGMGIYLRYLETWEKKDAIKTSAALMACALFKPTFLIGTIPMLAIFPFEKLMENEFRSKLLSHAPWVALAFAPMPLWNVISNFLNVKETLTAGTITRVDLLRIFTSRYWSEFSPIIKAYIADNFTWFYVYLAVIGLAIALLRFRSKLTRFLVGYAVAVIPYAMILADYLKGHNYYQFPFLPLVCIASAYVIYTIGTVAKQVVKIKQIQYLSLLLLLIPVADVRAHTDAQFNTVFYGLDVVAEYLKEHSEPDEYLFMSGHAQSFGVCFNAERWCGPPWWEDLNKTIKTENDRNFRWLFIHGGQGIYEMQLRPDIWDYFQKNYRVRLIGLGPTQMDGQPLPEVYLFEKGGNFTLETLNQVPFTQEIKQYDRRNADPVQMIVLEDNR